MHILKKTGLKAEPDMKGFTYGFAKNLIGFSTQYYYHVEFSTEMVNKRDFFKFIHHNFSLFKLQAMHNIDPLMSEFKDTMEKTDALMSKLAELCQVESSNVRKTNFYRAKHALTHAEKKKTQLQQLIRRFTEMVSMAIQVVKFSSGGYKIRKIFA